MQKLTKILLLITIPIVITLLSFESVAFDTNLFLKKINDYGVFEKLNKDNVESQVINLVDYLKGKEDLEYNFYSEKEIKHLEDVKKIFFILNSLSYLFYIFIIILLLYLRKKFGKTEFLKTLLAGGLISFGFYIFLLLILLNSFDTIFYYLHTILFSNNYWLLNPDNENLVVIFPTQFFVDMSQLIFAKTIMVSLLTALISLAVLKFNRKK